MRIVTTSLVIASLALQLGIAAADPIPGAAGDARPRQPAATAVPLPSATQIRPVTPVQRSLLLPAVQAARESARNANTDQSVDQMLGMLAGDPAAAASEGARHIYVDENGDLACVTLDTFFPEPC